MNCNPRKNLIRLVIMLSLVGLFIVSAFSVSIADTSGVTLIKDVMLEYAINGPKDLPDEILVSLYDAESSVEPVSYQVFKRGEYSLDFEFNKSDGLTSGAVARFKFDFTNPIELSNFKNIYELWMEITIGDSAVGVRSKIAEEELVSLLLNSGSSLVTYITFLYEGDENPLLSIYKKLPISLKENQTTEDYLAELLSPLYYSNEDGTRLVAGTENYKFLPQADQTVTGDLSVDGRIFSNGASEWGTAPMVLGQDLSNRGLIITDKAGSNQKNIYMGWNVGASFDYAELFAVHEGVAFKDLVLNPYSANVGIGTTQPAYKLSVNGSIGCKELTVTDVGWADYVFEDDYKLPKLEDVAQFISENKHLPDIPSEFEVKKNGVNLGEMNSKLLKKIEELTLYLIDIQEKNDQLMKKIAALEDKVYSEK